MTLGNPLSDSELLDAVIELLKSKLPQTWGVEAQATSDGADADLLLRTPNSAGTVLLLVDAKWDVQARDVRPLLDGPWPRWRRRLGNQPVLFISSYLTPKVRSLLKAEDINYVDLTGNIRISLDYPGVFIESPGADRDPRRTDDTTRGLRGAKAGAVVRFLTDFRPPYAASTIARASGVSEGYLSRLLDSMVAEGLVDRDGSGPIMNVDWPALLRRRARATSLFRKNATFRYIARRGASAVVNELRAKGVDLEPVPTITGSFAASRLAPVAAPSLLVIYCMDRRMIEARLELLPADEGADTVLIRPDNNVVFDRSDIEMGFAWAAPSQVVIDCLSGTGRMPSEGEALIGWMQSNEKVWRRPMSETETLTGGLSGG